MLTPRENLQLLFDGKMPEYLPLGTDFEQAFFSSSDFVNERPDLPGVNKDWFGQSWTYEPIIGAANPTPNCPLVTDITRWSEQMHFPDLDSLDWEGKSAEQTAKWDRENKMVKATIGFGIWERMFSVMKFDECLVALLEEPEACFDFFSAVADYKIKLHDKIIQYYKPDVLVMHDDYGNTKDMFMAPETWRALLKPNLARVVSAVQSKGVIYEHHNCGYFLKIIDDMLEIGIRMTNNVHYSNNHEFLKSHYNNKMILVGGFASQRIDNPNATLDEIRGEIRTTLDTLAPNGGYIASFRSSRPEANVIAAEELSRASKLYYNPRPEDK